MEGFITVKEALETCKKYNVTSSEQVLRRWIRERRLKALIWSDKKGYRICKDSFITFLNTFDSYKAIRSLEKIERLKEEIRLGEQLRSDKKAFQVRYLEDQIRELEKMIEELERKEAKLKVDNKYLRMERNGLDRTMVKELKEIRNLSHPDKLRHDHQSGSLFARINKLYKSLVK